MQMALWLCVGKTQELVLKFEKRTETGFAIVSFLHILLSRLTERIPNILLFYYYSENGVYDKFRLQMLTDRAIF